MCREGPLHAWCSGCCTGTVENRNPSWATGRPAREYMAVTRYLVVRDQIIWVSTPVWLPFRYAVPWMVLHWASWADISLSYRPDICPPGPATDIWCRACQISAAVVTRYPAQDWPDICPGVLDQISGACYWQISCGWLGRGPDIWGPLRQIIWPRQPRPDICPPKVTRFWGKSGTSNRYLALWGDIWSANEPATLGGDPAGPSW